MCSVYIGETVVSALKRLAGGSGRMYIGEIHMLCSVYIGSLDWRHFDRNKYQVLPGESSLSGFLTMEHSK